MLTFFFLYWWSRILGMAQPCLIPLQAAQTLLHIFRTQIHKLAYLLLLQVKILHRKSILTAKKDITPIMQGLQG